MKRKARKLLNVLIGLFTASSVLLLTFAGCKLFGYHLTEEGIKDLLFADFIIFVLAIWIASED